MLRFKKCLTTKKKIITIQLFIPDLMIDCPTFDSRNKIYFYSIKSSCNEDTMQRSSIFVPGLHTQIVHPNEKK